MNSDFSHYIRAVLKTVRGSVSINHRDIKDYPGQIWRLLNDIVYKSSPYTKLLRLNTC
jgi:hypothetical protein